MVALYAGAAMALETVGTRHGAEVIEHVDHDHDHDDDDDFNDRNKAMNQATLLTIAEK